MTVHALVPQCALSVLSYSECKIAKIIRGFAPGPHWRGLTAPPPPPRLPWCTTVFLLATLVEKPANPQKLLDAALLLRLKSITGYQPSCDSPDFGNC